MQVRVMLFSRLAVGHIVLLGGFLFMGCGEEDVREKSTEAFQGAPIPATSPAVENETPTGTARVSVKINTSPKVISMGKSNGNLTPGVAQKVWVVAVDKDADVLSFAWEASCPGVFSHGTWPMTWFVPSPAASKTDCSLVVKVQDGKGGLGVGELVLPMVSATINVAPTIGVAWQTDETVQVGDVMQFHLQAKDPEGQAISFAWHASCGRILWQQDQALESRIAWVLETETATDCTMATTVRDMEGATSRYEFPIKK